MFGNRFTWQHPILTAVILSVFLLGIATGCKDDKGNPYGGDDGGGNPGANEVWIQNNAFSPPTRTVSVNTTVTWTNKDGAAHTVTSGTPGVPNGDFNSGNMAPGATFSHQFTAAGSYPYYCGIHQSMTGTITVQ